MSSTTRSVDFLIRLFNAHALLIKNHSVEKKTHIGLKIFALGSNTFKLIETKVNPDRSIHRFS